MKLSIKKWWNCHFQKDTSPTYKAIKQGQLKDFEFNILLLWNGKDLQKLEMTIQAPDRASAKQQIVSLLEFKISSLTEKK